MNSEIMKQTVCLEACNQLHEIGALRHNLQERGNEPYIEMQPSYFPPEPVGHVPKNSNIYHCYLMELEQKFDIPLHDIVLVLRNKLESELESLHFDLDVDRGSLPVNFKYVGVLNLSKDQVHLCTRFQETLLRVLRLKILNERMDGDILGAETDYLLLPATGKHQRPVIIDWHCVNSVLFSCKKNGEFHLNCALPKDSARIVQTEDGPVCTCLLQNSLVYIHHTDQFYCTTGILGLNANSRMQHLRGKMTITYKEYYEKKHEIELCFEHESLVSGIPIFRVKNYLERCRNHKEKESRMLSVELPPELCSIVMSPISINTFYSFSFVPSILHRVESLLIDANLKKMHSDHCTQNDVIPISKVRYPSAAMVLRIELCRFSGAKIYPGKGIRFVRSDSQVFPFANSKCKRYFHNRLKPSKLTWTAMYRKQHKKDIAAEAVKKKRRAAKKPYSRSIVGATLEVIQKKRAEKPEVRDAAREAALREIKERIKKTKDEKAAKKAEVTAKTQKTQNKGNVTKGAAPKGPRLGGGGGKR